MPLEVMHCSAHKGSLANKDGIDDFQSTYHSLLSKQYFYFQESGDGLIAFQGIQNNLHLPKNPVQGSYQKWCGFAEAMDFDSQNWDAKQLYWASKVETDNSCGETTRLHVDCCKFYSSLKNRFLACGYTDIDLVQYRVTLILQDDKTPVSRIDPIVVNLVQTLIEMIFGTVTVEPALLTPTSSSEYNLQKLMHRIITDPQFAQHDFSSEVLDSCLGESAQAHCNDHIELVQTLSVPGIFKSS